MDLIDLHYVDNEMPIKINIDQIKAIYQSLSKTKQGTIIDCGGDDYYRVSESVKKVADLIKEKRKIPPYGPYGSYGRMF